MNLTVRQVRSMLCIYCADCEMKVEGLSRSIVCLQCHSTAPSPEDSRGRFASVIFIHPDNTDHIAKWVAGWLSVYEDEVSVEVAWV